MKDFRIEQYLKANGVKGTYVDEIPLERIIIDASARHQIRLEDPPTNEDTVLRYAESYEQGDRFPALVLYRTSGEKYGIINGLHREAAYRLLDVKTTDAYVLDLDPSRDGGVISRLRRSINVTEGRAPSTEEALQQAIQLVNEGMIAADAAKVLRLKPQRVYKQLNYEKSFDRIAKHSGLSRSEVERLGRSGVEDLGRVTNPKISGEMTKFAYEARLNATEIQEFSRQVRDALTDSEKESVVKRWREENASRIKATAGGRLTVPASRIRNLKLYGQKVTRELQSESMKALQRKDRVDAIRFLKRLITEIQGVIRRLESNGTTIGIVRKSVSRIPGH